MEVFRDAVVLDQALHTDDGRKSLADGNAYFFHFRRCLVSERVHHFLEFAQVVPALFEGLCFESQQVAELFLEGVTGMDGGVEFEEFMQGLFFPACEVAGSFSQGMDEGAFPGQ